MADAVLATAPTLPNFDDTAEWEPIGGVNVFDEHEEHDKDGNVVRSFKRADLQEIADNCNARAAAGNLCPITIGHTVDDPREPLQPESVGYARNFAVGWDQKLQRYVIRATYYLRKGDAEKAKTYPRTSVELWGRDKFFDPIALLRRTPQRDLGQWTYARGGQPKLRYAMDTDRDGLPDAVDPNPTVPNATPPAEAEPPLAPEHAEMADKFWKHYLKTQPVFKYMCDKYAAEAQPAPAFPSATNGQVPAATDPERARMQKDSDAIRYARIEQDVAAEKARNDALKAELDQFKLLYRKSEAERIATQLEGENIDLDRPKFVAKLVRLPDSEWEPEIEEKRQFNRRRPGGDGFIPTAAGVGDPAPGQKNGMSPDRFSKATDYMRKNGVSWKEAVEKSPE